MTLSALLIIDVQNDFLAPGGAFNKRHIEPRQLCKAIAWLVEAARQQQRVIVWVTSHYGEIKETAAGKTHLGKPCCIKNTWGSEIVEDLQPTFAQKTKNETHIIKHYYDAFHETNLDRWLRSQNITQLSLCGVTTNICVSHTAKTALKLGYEVEILEGVTSASTHNTHLKAVRSLSKLGATSRHWGELLKEGNAVRLNHVAGNSVLSCNSLTAIGDRTFATLDREIAWQQMNHRGNPVPRLIALQGTKEADGVEPLYRHPADEQPPLTAWSPTIDAIRREAEQIIGHPLNHCLIQLYRHGRDWIGKHADKTLDVRPESFIVNVSIGTTRTMIFRSKSKDNRVVQKLPLPHGSLFMLSLDSNRAFYHEIEKLGSQGTNEPRISLTLRYIGTHYDPNNGAVWGIGAPSKTRAEANERVKWIESLSPTEKLVKDKAEAERMVSLFREENIDPNFDLASYQPGFDILDFQDLL